MGRYSRLRYIQTLDPEADCEQITNLVVRYEFPFEYRFGFAFGILTDVAFPNVSRQLVQTGQIRDHGQKRYDDGMLFDYEMKRAGLSSPDGRATVRKLNQIHSNYDISNDDYLCTLAAHIVGPVRWINTYGWRPISDHETRALVAANRGMGRLMGIKHMPVDYQSFDDLLSEALRERARYQDSNRAAAHQIIRVVQQWWPAPLRRYVPAVVTALLDEPLRALLGLPHVSRAFEVSVRTALKARGGLLRWTPPRPSSRPYIPKPRTYPTGWTLDQLGPILPQPDRA